MASQFRMHPALLLSLAAAWGAGSLYLFATGVFELFEVNHEMSELLTKGNTMAAPEPTAPVRLHIGWRLVAGIVSLGAALSLFRWHHSQRHPL